MSSFDVAVFAFERWLNAGSLLRRYRLFDGGASILDGRVVGVNRRTSEVSFLPTGAREPIVWNISGASFEYSDLDDGMPEELTRVFVGHFLKIEFEDEDELFLIGELVT